MNAKTKRRTLAIFVLLVVVSLISGCASPMALEKGNNKLDISGESIALMRFRISNQVKPNWQPKIQIANLHKLGNRMSARKFNPDGAFRGEKNSYNEYLISFRAKPGKYVVGDVIGFSGSFPIEGNCYAPVYKSFDLGKNEIIYLGYVDTTIRRRNNDEELRAGSVLPLIDQAVTGFGNGTPVITISDNYEKDIKAFVEAYPQLRGHQVRKAVMQKWTPPPRKSILPCPGR